MRCALISDIHSNLEALQAVLEASGDLPLLVLGDVIGYGADPNRCIELVRQRQSAVIMGNHEQVQLDWRNLEKFNPIASQSAVYTRDRLTADHLAWMRTLPQEMTLEGVHLSHGSPASPAGFHYLLPGDVRSPYVALSFAKLERLGISLAFVGHTHVPGIFEASGAITYRPMDLDGIYQLKPNCSAIVNCGSVGQPRNGNADAQFVILDTEARTVEKRSVIYDVMRAAAKIRVAGLPDELWQRLLQGI